MSTSKLQHKLSLLVMSFMILMVITVLALQTYAQTMHSVGNSAQLVDLQEKMMDG